MRGYGDHAVDLRGEGKKGGFLISSACFLADDFENLFEPWMFGSLHQFKQGGF